MTAEGAEATADEADVEALAEEIWAASASPGAAPTEVERNIARSVLASGWLAARVQQAEAERDEAQQIYAELHEEWGHRPRRGRA